MNLSAIESQILKTGFVLEHQVSQLLKKAGWTVISNKYYIDDNEDTVREIDLVAYKAKAVQHFFVYTVLIISCKKSDANAWTLLSRELNRHDPNIDWQPLHLWSNDKALAYQIAQPAFATNYHQSALSSGGLPALAEPEMDVFAFQEMNCKSGAPQNDKAIFSSITSLMKAQSYELNALPSRKKDLCLYQFSLLSVVDADLVRIVFDDKPPKAQEIESENYIASYIIKKTEEFSKIRFIKASAFDRIIQDYDQLHNFNCEVFSELCDSFYENIFEDSKRTRVVIDDFKKMVTWRLQWSIHSHFNLYPEIKDIYLEWKSKESILEVQLPLNSEHLEFLNEDADAKASVTRALANVYRYKGPFVFAEEDIPF